jgi:branched-subunit amino acid transport protein
MAVVTFIPRFLPLALFSRWTPGPRLRLFLSYIPVAILSAILFPILFSTPESPLSFEPRLLVSALPVAVLAYVFRNLWLAVIAGMLVYWVMG